MGRSKQAKQKTESAGTGCSEAAVGNRFVDMTQEEVDAFLARMDALATSKDAMVVRGMAAMVRCLTEEIKAKGATLGRLRAIAFGAPTEKTRNVFPPKDAAGRAEAQQARKERRAQEKSGQPAPGHGPKGSKGFPSAERIKLPHTILTSGGCCPECLDGHLHPTGRPAIMTRIVAMAPINAKVIEREVLRCGSCYKTFTADLPEGFGSGETYDETVPAMIGYMRFGTGLPYTRFSYFLKNLGAPIATSTMSDLVIAAAATFDPVLDELMRQAAQGELIYQDDTVMKILDRYDLIKKRGKGKKERKGTYTTGLIAKAGEHKVALFITGQQHAGENLADLLKLRSAELAQPIQMCDALASNTAGKLDTIVAHCLAHARRKFVEVVNKFPEECRFLLETLRVVYVNDSACAGMSPAERLAYHQEHSGPGMEALSKWLHQQIDDKLVEPNSGLGRAIQYTINHWMGLTLFLREPGAPLDNNTAERGLKRAIMHRKNSLFYKTQEGARVGDLYMSLIHTAELNGANPFDYLVALQRNHAFVEENPEEWMPWNYQETLKGLPG
jgi:transposase